MLTETIRARMLEALKAGDTVAKNVLKVALGEVQAAQVRAGKDLGEEEVVRIVRKLVGSDEESRAATRDEARRAVLTREIEVLEALLPRVWPESRILEALEAIRDQLQGAANDGQATGIALRHLKGIGAPVDGKDVARAVKRRRA